MTPKQFAMMRNTTKGKIASMRGLTQHILDLPVLSGSEMNNIQLIQQALDNMLAVWDSHYEQMKAIATARGGRSASSGSRKKYK